MRVLLWPVLVLFSGAEAMSLSKIEVAEGVPGLIGGAKVGSPAIIVIQEWWGLTPQIEEHALRIAKEGYRVFVPDIYKGKMGVDAEEASHLMSSLDFANAVEEISKAAAYLKSEGAPAVGVTGFCMGGALTLGALARSPDLIAGAPFYGVNFGLFTDELNQKAIQGHFGQEDKLAGFADAETANQLKEKLPHADVFLYPKVGHAFMNESPAPFESFEDRSNKAGFPPYDPEVAELAWSRLFTFFHAHLAPTSQDL